MRIKDISLIPTRNGISKPKKFHGRGMKVVNMKELFGNDRIGDIEMLRVEHTDSERKLNELFEGDLLFGRRSLVLEGAGKCSIVNSVKEPTSFESSIIRVRLNPKLANPVFYYYLFQSNLGKGYLQNIVTGTAVFGIRGSDLYKMKVPYPTLSEQSLIAKALSDYDELIENNTKRIAILEQMAEQIYKEWFVRMRFPGYENTKFVKGTPEGWEVSNIKDFGKVVTGKTPSTNVTDYYDGPYPFIKTPDMHGNIFILETGETLSQRGVDSQKSQFIPANSISVSCIGTGGVVSISNKPSMTNQQINTLIFKEDYLREYLFFTLRGLKETIELFGATGATMTNLSKGKFEKLLVLRPKEEILLSFGEIVKPVFDEIKNLGEQNISLKSSRDLLLPRLISGKLSVEHLTSNLQETA